MTVFYALLAAAIAVGGVALARQRTLARAAPRRQEGGHPAVDARIAAGRAEIWAAVRRRQEALARFPAAGPTAPAEPPAAAESPPGWRLESAFGWLGSRFVTGFLWGALIGLALEALAIIALARLAADIRRVGL